MKLSFKRLRMELDDIVCHLNNLDDTDKRELKEWGNLIIKGTLRAIIFVLIMTDIFILDWKVFQLNGVVVFIFLYVYIAYTIFKKRRIGRLKVRISLILFSLILLASSREIKHGWFADFYLNLGVTTIFVPLIDILLLRFDKETSQKISIGISANRFHGFEQFILQNHRRDGPNESATRPLRPRPGPRGSG